MIDKLLLSLGWRRKKPVIRKSAIHIGYWECSSRKGFEVIGKTPLEAYKWWAFMFDPKRLR